MADDAGRCGRHCSFRHRHWRRRLKSTRRCALAAANLRRSANDSGLVRPSAQREWEGRSPCAHAPPRSMTPAASDYVRSLMASILASRLTNPEAPIVLLSDDVDLRDEGIVDSLGFVQLISELEVRLG